MFVHQAELWDPDAWAQLFSDAGAKFVLFTSKHCDGWANWKSPVKWNYNSVDNGPHRDLVGELTNATVTKGMRMGLYCKSHVPPITLYLLDTVRFGIVLKGYFNW